ncbi:hypothetical protein ACQVP2_09055 [Methylobacterium aquaticum]|uniref:hypothetical protein n=1 Tax=Methylobacterium aquaticum TaxID=270351 RepID=UPI003D17F3BD
MARPLPLPLVCRSAEPLRIVLASPAAAARRRSVARLPLAMLMRGLAVMAGLGVPVAAATLAGPVHSVPFVSTR